MIPDITHKLRVFYSFNSIYQKYFKSRSFDLNHLRIVSSDYDTCTYNILHRSSSVTVSWWLPIFNRMRELRCVALVVHAISHPELPDSPHPKHRAGCHCLTGREDGRVVQRNTICHLEAIAPNFWLTFPKSCIFFWHGDNIGDSGVGVRTCEAESHLLTVCPQCEQRRNCHFSRHGDAGWLWLWRSPFNRSVPMDTNLGLYTCLLPWVSPEKKHWKINAKSEEIFI